MAEIRDNFIKSLDDSQCGITSKMEGVYSMLKEDDEELYLKLVSQLKDGLPNYSCIYNLFVIVLEMMDMLSFWLYDMSTLNKLHLFFYTLLKIKLQAACP